MLACETELEYSEKADRGSCAGDEGASDSEGARMKSDGALVSADGSRVMTEGARTPSGGVEVDSRGAGDCEADVLGEGVRGWPNASRTGVSGLSWSTLFPIAGSSRYWA